MMVVLLYDKLFNYNYPPFPAANIHIPREKFLANNEQKKSPFSYSFQS